MRSADVSREIYPAVNLNLAVFPSLTAWSFVNRLHQWIRWELAGITDDLSPTDLPISRGKRWRIERRRWNTTRSRRCPWFWRRVSGGAQLLQKRFSQALREWFV